MSYTVMPSVLTMTNTVLRECGQPSVASLSPGTKISTVVLDALNDAAADIYNRGRFEFMKTDYTFALTADEDEYTLPANFGRLELPLRVSTATSTTFVERTAEEFWAEVYGSPDVLTTSGSPRIYYIGAGKIHLWPAPSSTYVTSAPNLTYTYYLDVPARLDITDGSSSLDLPLSFYDAVKKYAKARLKEYLEDGDSVANLQEYERALQIQLNRSREGLKAPQMRTYYGPTRLR